MPLSDWQPLPLVTTGDMWTAAQHNTYVRQNQQILRDALALGHGQGSNVDMVDGRHAAEGVYPNLAWVDKLTIPIPIGFEGWVTIADVIADRAVAQIIAREEGCCAVSVYTITATGGYPRHLAVWRGGGYSELIRAFRMSSSEGYPPKTWLEAYVVDPNDGNPHSLVLFLVTPTAEASQWHLGDNGLTGPRTPKKVVGARNGAWRLARSLTGTSAPVGWMTPSQKQARFAFVSSNLFSSSNYTLLLDGSTSSSGVPGFTTASSWVYKNVVLDAGAPIALDSIKATFSRGGSEYWYTYLKVEYSDDGTTWVSLGTNTSSQIHYSTSAHTNQVTFAPTAARYWRLTFGAKSGNTTSQTFYPVEAEFEVAASLTVQGVPTGCSVRLYNAAGTLLEEKRNEGWNQSSAVMLTADVSQVDRIDITRPDGVTDWLSYPLDLDGASTVDGGALQNGDVLTLYREE